jgi:hypothetical protein
LVRKQTKRDSLSYAKGGEDDVEHAPAPLAGIPKGWPKE